MDVSKILAELRAERALLDEVIANLERVATVTEKRKPGRPRKHSSTVKSFPPVSENPVPPGPPQEARAGHSA